MLFVQKYPRYAKTIAAFMGGTGGSAPFSDSYKEALGYGLREAACITDVDQRIAKIKF